MLFEMKGLIKQKICDILFCLKECIIILLVIPFEIVANGNIPLIRRFMKFR